MTRFYIVMVLVFSTCLTFGQVASFESLEYDSIIHFSYKNNPDNLEPTIFNEQIEKYIQSSFRLKKLTEQKLSELTNDSSNFRNSECGTPFYEGSFVFYLNGQQIAKCYYACDNTQMYFEPRNLKSKYGALTIEGQTILKEIIK